MEIYDVVVKLIGPINPVGETYTDDERYTNLKAMSILVDRLLYDINQVASFSTRSEHSMKRAGDFASCFMKEIAEADRG